ncbi:MAG: hypothetical protein ACREIA_13985 [Opitutaceae bacterium]
MPAASPTYFESAKAFREWLTASHATQARWAWHIEENVHEYTLADASREFTQADGRVVPYPVRNKTRPRANGCGKTHTHFLSGSSRSWWTTGKVLRLRRTTSSRRSSSSTCGAA